jgi:AraC-like DNA-binding protein
MAPGSLLLGNAGQSFECGHEHGAGDRCISFHYEPGYFESLASAAGASARNLPFRRLRLPPLPASSWLIAQACAGLDGSAFLSWEELGAHVAAKAIQTLRDSPLAPETPSRSLAWVTQAVRAIEQHPAAAHSLASLAREARLSSYHFLRIFERVAGVTPHRYVMRTRLRKAAIRLMDSHRLSPSRNVDLALDCGFGDLSHFNHAFRAEFGCSPRAYRVKGSPFAGTAGAS